MSWNEKNHSAPKWPDDENGEPVPPVFLRHIHGGPLDMELTLNILEAYGIPHLNQYPNDGLFGKLILGYPPGGIDVYVPEAMLEDAQNLLTTNAEYDDIDDSTTVNNGELTDGHEVSVDIDNDMEADD